MTVALSDPAGAVDGLAEALYLSLPGGYLDADAVVGGDVDLPLARLAAALAVPVEEAAALVDRMAASLGDPLTADAAWLTWLGPLVGTDVRGIGGEQARRDAIASASSGWLAGATESVASAARSALTGTRYVRVTRHRTAAGAGSWFDLLLTTRTMETPDVGAVLGVVVEKRVKPAGVRLHHRAYAVSWSVLTAQRPTWADRAGVSWALLTETGADT